MEHALRESEFKKGSPSNNLLFAIWGKGSEEHNQHWPWGTLTAMRPEASRWPSFMFVRNPFDRIISEFSFQVKIANCTHPRPHSRGHQENDINRAIFDQSIFQLALPWHSTAQHVFKGPETEVYRFEDLPAAWEEIQEKYGVSEELPCPQREERDPWKYGVSELPCPQREWQRILDEQSQKAVRAVYEEDFKQFYPDL